MSAGAKGLALGALLGFLGAGAVLALLRRFAKEWLYRVAGVEAELRAAQEKEAKRQRVAWRKQMWHVGKWLQERVADGGQDKRFLAAQLTALAILNHETDSSKNFTFWQRRTSKIQSDLERLRATLE
jgi:hypothetical protein